MVDRRALVASPVPLGGATLQIHIRMVLRPPFPQDSDSEPTIIL